MVYLSLICLLLVWVPYVSEGLFVFLDFLIHSVLQLLGLFEQLPLPQLNTLMLGMGSLFCLIMLVFFIDRYFMVLMKIDDRSNSQLNRQISFSLMGVFLG